MPIYTIIAATAAQYQIDRVYGGTTAVAASAQVLDAYITMPEDFQRFITVLDPANNWQLHIWMTDDELNTWDPQRSSSGTPFGLASRRLVTQGSASLIGRAQYELWPYPTSARNYPYYYIRRAETLTDSSRFLGVFAQRADVLIQGALAYCSEWPGAEDRRNPYFNLGLASQKREQFYDQLDRLLVLDQELYPTWLETISQLGRYPFAPLDARYLQDVTMPSW